MSAPTLSLAAAAALLVSVVAGTATPQGAAAVHLEPSMSPRPVSAVQDLPEGPGKDLLPKLCAGCHDLMFTVSTRETREGWTRVVNDMRAKGADGSDADFDAVIGYLVAHFGKPEPAAAIR